MAWPGSIYVRVELEDESGEVVFDIAAYWPSGTPLAAIFQAAVEAFNSMARISAQDAITYGVGGVRSYDTLRLPVRLRRYLAPFVLVTEPCIVSGCPVGHSMGSDSHAPRD